MCRVLGVSRSGWYAWCSRPRPTKREVDDAKRLADIRRIHEESRGTYGSPRVRQQLKREGSPTSKTRVERLMRDAGLTGKVRRRFKKTTDSKHAEPIAENILNRRFEAESSDSVWCADITYIPTASGWAYLAAIIDIPTRLVVGWSMASHMRTELVEHALRNALSVRQPAANLIHHSDRGSQYASKSYRDLLEAHGIECSMSRRGNCWDNAVIESFFGTYKQELANHHRWSGLLEARYATHDFIEVFYNRQRLHSSLDYRTPAEVDATIA